LQCQKLKYKRNGNLGLPNLGLVDTRSQWCKANDLNLHQLTYWLKKIDNTKETSAPTT
jgi:hypothetical protein